MNDETNKLEALKLLNELGTKAELVRPNGEPVPKHWSIFTVGEMVVIKDYTFKIGHIGESHILIEPVAPVIIDNKKDE